MAPTIICPKTFQEVSHAVLLAQSEKKELAVTSGAHYSTSGSSFTADGVLVDLSLLNAVRVDAVEKKAYVQGGARFRQVEEEAITAGLAMPGGTVSDIGIGGLTVAGGYGWLTGQHGLVIDNLLSATVVVASGEVLAASALENSDLFWGISGGGSNFGIVVEFVFQLHEQRANVYTTSLVFSADLLPIVIQQVNRWTSKQTPDEAGSLTIFADEVTGKPMLEWFGFKNGDETAGKAAFKGFVALGPVRSTSGMIPYETLNTMMDNHVVPGVGNRLHMGTFLERLDLKPFKKALEAFAGLEDAARERSNVRFEFYHHAKMMSLGAEETAFAQRAEVYNALVSVQWTTPAPTFDGGAAAHSIVDKIVLATTAGPVEEAGLGYANYADHVAADRSKGDAYAKKAFGVNYKRMREVKKTYDPTSVFSRWFAVTPAE